MLWKVPSKKYKTTITTKIISKNKEVIKGEYEALKNRHSEAHKYVDQEVSVNLIQNTEITQQLNQIQALKLQLNAALQQKEEALKKFNDLRDKILSPPQASEIKSKPVFSDLDNNLAILRESMYKHNLAKDFSIITHTHNEKEQQTEKYTSSISTQYEQFMDNSLQQMLIEFKRHAIGFVDEMEKFGIEKKALQFTKQLPSVEEVIANSNELLIHYSAQLSAAFMNYSMRISNQAHSMQQPIVKTNAQPKTAERRHAYVKYISQNSKKEPSSLNKLTSIGFIEQEDKDDSIV